jgi:hypothetical protein
LPNDLDLYEDSMQASSHRYLYRPVDKLLKVGCLQFEGCNGQVLKRINLTRSFEISRKSSPVPPSMSRVNVFPERVPTTP